MSNFKTFMVSAHDDNLQVVLEVDMDKLTAERAGQINGFWSGADARAYEEDDDLVRTVVRLFGVRVIGLMLAAGGAHFDQATNPEWAASWSEEMHVLEGWGTEDGTPHGWCGIRVLSAECEVPGFEDVELHAGRPA